MLTPSERKCLALTLVFLAMGAGLKLWAGRSVVVGPEPVSNARGAATIPGTASLSGAVADSTRPTLAPSATGAAADSGAMDTAQAIAGEGPPAFSQAGFFSAPTPARAEARPPRRATSARVPAKKSAAPAPVALNQAGAAQLTGLPGIGEKTAQAILEYRRKQGGFKDARELLNVKGIGEKKLEKIRPFLVISPVD
jgi:competence protein ComEA